MSGTLPPPRTEPPALFIIAGPNGSGKSSAYENANIETLSDTIWIVNPDLLTARIREVEKLDLDAANLAAVTRIEAWLGASIDVHKSVGVETVLSTPKYRRWVERARVKGFVIGLIYVLLDTPERNIERVRLRVKKGGHAVPDDKVRARYHRSLEQLPWFFEQADRAWIYDNSGASPALICEKRDGVATLAEDALPQIVSLVQAMQTS